MKPSQRARNWSSSQHSKKPSTEARVGLSIAAGRRLIMDPTTLKQAIRSAMTEELLLRSFERQFPLPSDMEAELVVLAALVTGEAAPEVADHLTAADFYLPIHGWAFDKWRAGMKSPEAMRDAAHAEGMQGARLYDALEALWCQPIVIMPPIEKWVERIRAASVRRDICSVCERVALEVRLSTMDESAALRTLRELVEK